MTEDPSGADEPSSSRSLEDVRYVGPATADLLADAGVDADDVLSKDVSYRQLVEAGVNHGVATKLRREHSLPWSFGGAGPDDLDRRSEAVRGLQDGERAWVAASTGDWEATSAGTDGADGGTEAAEADGSGEAAAAEAAWRERSRPDPVTDVPGVSEPDARELAKAGINSVRSLATADPEQVADLLEMDAERVATWRDDAAEMS